MASRSFDRTWSEAFKACKQALKELDWELTAVDKHQGTIDAERSGNFLAFGHSAQVDIKELKNGRVKVTVKTEAIGPQVIDWGTSAKHEQRILDALSEMLA